MSSIGQALEINYTPAADACVREGEAGALRHSKERDTLYVQAKEGRFTTLMAHTPSQSANRQRRMTSFCPPPWKLKLKQYHCLDVTPLPEQDLTIRRGMKLAFYICYSPP
ncbi:hypothetical protein AGIG_G23249 [Arapaima gigas]